MSHTSLRLASGARVSQQRLGSDLDLLRIAEAGALEREGETALFWEHPETQRAILAVGAVQHFTASGPGRLSHIAAEARALLANVDGRLGVRPLVLGGFAFAEAAPAVLPSAWFFLPQRLWLKHRDQCHHIEVQAPLAPPPAGSHGPVARSSFDDRPTAWRARVERVLELIRCGKVNKIVLSRRRHCDGLAVPLRELLVELRATRPQCVTFAMRAGAATFFGSSPELMLRVDARGLYAPALAGTVPRGRSAAADEHCAAALLACGKNRREHDAVVDGIVCSLRQLGITPAVGPTEVFRLPEAMHLRTDIGGRSPSTLDVLCAAAVLHPTAAVCGTPRAQAAAFLREHEPDRGWYTGGIGWMDSRGAGEVVVGLRSALADASGLTVYAGAGIVAGSEAQAELEETELKMEAMMAPLRALAARHAGETAPLDHAACG